MKACNTVNLMEKIRFQQGEIEKLKNEILGSDKNSIKKYVSTFNREHTDYRSVSSFDDLYGEASKADIIYLGDYHALPACQEFHADFIDNLAKRSPRLIIAVEMLYGRNQPAMDDWMNGAITEQSFLKRVRYDTEWGYSWESYRKIFEVSKKHKICITAIDCEPRNDLRMIHRRDIHAAFKILSLLKSKPDHTLIIIFGESHLASKHLPYRVKKLLRREGLRKREMIVFQNIDEIYWNLACRGFEDERVVQIQRHKFCVFTATPFIKYESYRQLLERWKSHNTDEDDNTYLTSTVYNLIDIILNFIQVNKYEYCLVHDGRCMEFMIDAYPEIYAAEDDDLFAALLRSSHLSKNELQQMVYHIAQQGSCYVPSINAIYIPSLNLMHAAEQAAHFIHLVCKRGSLRAAGRRARRIDAFYERVIEEALGYFGSKLIDPSRDQLKTSAFMDSNTMFKHEMRKSTGLSARDFEFIKRFIGSHKSIERDPRDCERLLQQLLRVVRSSGRKYAIITHELGYIFGEQLYRGYLLGELSRDEIAKLFLAKPDRKKATAETYFNLATRLIHLL